MRMTIFAACAAIVGLLMGGCPQRPDSDDKVPTPNFKVVPAGDVQVGITQDATPYTDKYGSGLTAQIITTTRGGETVEGRIFPPGGDPPTWIAGPFQLADGPISAKIRGFQGDVQVFETDPVEVTFR